MKNFLRIICCPITIDVIVEKQMTPYRLQIYFKLWTEYKMRIFVQNCWILGQVYLTSCMGTVIITTFYSERATGE